MESETKTPSGPSAPDAAAAPPPSYPASSAGPPYTDDKTTPADKPVEPSGSTLKPSAAAGAAGARPGAKPSSAAKSGSTLDRMMSKKNKALSKKFLTSYGKAWVGLSPIWLLGEALHPDKNVKVGTLFKQSASDVVQTAFEIRDEVALDKSDVVVIVDKHLRTQPHETVGKTAEVLKAAGEHALVVVTTNITKARDQITKSSPDLKRTMQTSGRDAIVIVDRQLKNPIVVTGVSKFARARGIPAPEALLRLASLGLGVILKAIDEAVEKEKEALRKAEAEGKKMAHEAKEYVVQELDAEDLQRHATQEEAAEADKIGKEAEGVEKPEVRQSSDAEDEHEHEEHHDKPKGGAHPPKGGKKDDSQCVMM